MSYDNFGFEWLAQASHEYGLEETTVDFVARTGIEPGTLDGKSVLDAGCGPGRHLRVVRRFGAKAVGIDASLAVRVSKAVNPDAEVLRADILHLPFRDGVFDAAYSLGVVHHSPNARGCVHSLARSVRSGGRLAISVYSDEGAARKVSNRLGEAARSFTRRLEMATVFRLSVLFGSIPLPSSLVGRRPLLWPTTILNFFFPFVSTTTTKEGRIYSTFDYLSPIYQSKHTYAEVQSWFIEDGFRSVERLDVPVSVVGLKL